MCDACYYTSLRTRFNEKKFDAPDDTTKSKMPLESPKPNIGVNYFLRASILLPSLAFFKSFSSNSSLKCLESDNCFQGLDYKIHVPFTHHPSISLPQIIAPNSRKHSPESPAISLGTVQGEFLRIRSQSEAHNISSIPSRHSSFFRSSWTGDEAAASTRASSPSIASLHSLLHQLDKLKTANNNESSSISTDAAFTSIGTASEISWPIQRHILHQPSTTRPSSTPHLQPIGNTLNSPQNSAQPPPIHENKKQRCFLCYRIFSYLQWRRQCFECRRLICSSCSSTQSLEASFYAIFRNFLPHLYCDLCLHDNVRQAVSRASD